MRQTGSENWDDDNFWNEHKVSVCCSSSEPYPISEAIKRSEKCVKVGITSHVQAVKAHVRGKLRLDAGLLPFPHASPYGCGSTLKHALEKMLKVFAFTYPLEARNSSHRNLFAEHIIWQLASPLPPTPYKNFNIYQKRTERLVVIQVSCDHPAGSTVLFFCFLDLNAKLVSWSRVWQHVVRL